MSKRYKYKSETEDVENDSESDMDEEVSPIEDALNELVDFFEVKLKSHELAAHTIVAELGKFKATIEKKIEKAKAIAMPPGPPPLVRQSGKADEKAPYPSPLTLPKADTAAPPLKRPPPTPKNSVNKLYAASTFTMPAASAAPMAVDKDE